LVVTDSFVDLAVIQAEALNVEVPLLVIPHPLGGLDSDLIAERVIIAIQQLNESVR
jgi:hypothetical protein